MDVPDLLEVLAPLGFRYYSISSASSVCFFFSEIILPAPPPSCLPPLSRPPVLPPVPPHRSFSAQKNNSHSSPQLLIFLKVFPERVDLTVGLLKFGPQREKFGLTSNMLCGLRVGTVFLEKFRGLIIFLGSKVMAHVHRSTFKLPKGNFPPLPSPLPPPFPCVLFSLLPPSLPHPCILPPCPPFFPLHCSSLIPLPCPPSFSSPFSSP
jgi:hypothetical protein